VVTAIDLAPLQAWIGREEVRSDIISAAPVARLSAALDYGESRAVQGQTLPLPWHWLYFLPATAASDVDVDGHGKRGGFLPPVPLPRRMWAASSIQVQVPLAVGDRVRRASAVVDVSHKQGGSGQLVFVTLRHRVFRQQGPAADGQLALEEEQSLVYREAAGSGAPSRVMPPPAEAQWSRRILPDPVLLFRYSALTFNSHRIHYDRDYAIGVEGYPGLVLQGPLTATLLLDLLYREVPGAQVVTFSFRGIRPLLEGQPLQVQGRLDGRSARLWALDASGALAMEAQASLL